MPLRVKQPTNRVDRAQNKFGRWRIVITASSGVEKDVVFAVSDEFYISPKSLASDSRVIEKKSAQAGILEQQQDAEIKTHEWAENLARRSNNSNYLDSMKGTVSGAFVEDLERPGGMGCVSKPLIYRI